MTMPKPIANVMSEIVAFMMNSLVGDLFDFANVGVGVEMAGECHRVSFVFCGHQNSWVVKPFCATKAWQSDKVLGHDVFL